MNFTQTSAEAGFGKTNFKPTNGSFPSISLFWPIIAGLGALIALNPMRIKSDCALYLEMGRQLLEGKLPYVDFGEVNPPLIIYLNAIPAFVAEYAGINVILVFLFMILGLLIWSTLSIRKSVLVSGLSIGESDLQIPMVFWVLCSASVYILGDFGQRDHLFLMLFVPYFVIRWIRWENGTVRLVAALVTGFAGAIGVCIKPHYLLIPLAGELYWIIVYRSFRNLIRPETVVFVLTGLLYGVHFLLLPEVVRKNIFEWWLPFILTHYHSYNTSFFALIQEKTFVPSIMLGLLPFVANSSGNKSLWSLARSLSPMVLASAVAYLWQHKGFGYHTIPYVGAASLILGIVIGTTFAFADQPPGPESFRMRITVKQTGILMGMVIAVLIAFLAAAVSMSIVNFRSGNPSPSGYPDTPFTRIISEHSKEGDGILAITTQLGGPTFPALLQMGRRPAHRYFFTFWIGMLYAGVKTDPDGKFPYRKMADAPKEEVRLLNELIEDIVKSKPKIIFVDSRHSCQGCPKGFRIMDYLSAIGFFDRAMNDYRELTREQGFRVFVLDRSGS